jgi:hypothetical protein
MGVSLDTRERVSSFQLKNEVFKLFFFIYRVWVLVDIDVRACSTNRIRRHGY